MREYTARINSFIDEICRMVPDCTEATKHRIYQVVRSNIKIVEAHHEVTGEVLERYADDVLPMVKRDMCRGLANEIVEKKMTIEEVEPSARPVGFMCRRRGEIHRHSVVMLRPLSSLSEGVIQEHTIVSHSEQVDQIVHNGKRQGSLSENKGNRG